MPDIRARRRSTVLVATSVPNAPVSKTANFQRTSGDDKEMAASIMFHRKLYGLLVLQYSTILLLASPFALLDSVKNVLLNHHTLHSLLECVSIGGIVLTMAVAVMYGSKYPTTQICLVTITIFVALELGLSFATGSVGLSGYIAVCQATTSFAIILSLLQFELNWLDYFAALVLCLAVALLWVVVLLEVGNHTLWTAVGIGMGGFAYVCIILFSSYTVEKHVTPDEYALATLFILCPEALLCIGSKERYVDETELEDEEGQTANEKDPLMPK
jgi:hypothetical protein